MAERFQPGFLEASSGVFCTTEFEKGSNVEIIPTLIEHSSLATEATNLVAPVEPVVVAKLVGYFMVQRIGETRPQICKVQPKYGGARLWENVKQFVSLSKGGPRSTGDTHNSEAYSNF